MSIALIKVFSTFDGGVKPGSVRNLEGPSALVKSCGLDYNIPQSVSVPQNFRFMFTYDPSLYRGAGPDVNC